MTDDPTTAKRCQVQDVKAWLETHPDMILLDCRQPEEYALCRIEGATLIPLPELPQRIDELDGAQDRLIVVYCHHGVRSMSATAQLRSSGFYKATSMDGGIDLWSRQIDPDVPRY